MPESARKLVQNEELDSNLQKNQESYVIQIDQSDKSFKEKLMKVFEMVLQCPIKLYSLLRPILTPTFEIVDLAKDNYYAAKFPHKEIWLVITL